MKEIYDHYLENTFGSYQPCKVKRAQFLFNYRRWFPQPGSGAKVLDIGPGRGEMLDVLAECGVTDCTGVDLSEEIVRFCRSRGFVCEWTDDTEAFLLRHENSCDLITVCDVLEHIDRNHTLPFLSAVRCALKPGGKAIFQVPNMAAEDAALYYYADFTHVAGFTELSLKQVLMTAGFSRCELHDYEVFCYGGIKEAAARLLRPFFYAWTRFRRRVIGSHCPNIITPVFFAVAEKGSGHENSF